MTALQPGLASPVDAYRFGEHRRRGRSTPAFRDAVPAAEAGRFHLYGAWSCPASHRLAILRAESGWSDAVSMSWVHGVRDGRGWAFRAETGVDPVNGFQLLREAYDATDAGHDGPVSVPLLWDRAAGRIVSNEPRSLGLDLLRTFGDAAGLYPEALAERIEQAGTWVARSLSTVVGCAVYRPEVATQVVATLSRLDALLAGSRHLVGEALTDADVRLWVGLVRYDAGPNAHNVIGPRLDSYPHLWRWARELYARPAFAGTTRWTAFTAPYADLPAWN